MAKKTNKKIKPYQSINLLNLPEFSTPAHIAVKLYGDLNSNRGYGNGYEIVITDCNNRVELHGGIRTPAKRKNALHKINTLIDEPTKAREHLISECKEKKVTIPK